MIIIAENEKELEFLTEQTTALQDMAKECNLTLKVVSDIGLLKNGAIEPCASSALLVKIKNGTHKQSVPMGKIIYIKHKDRTSYLHLENESLETSMTMKELAEILAPYGFIMVHRSYLVSVKNIKKVSYYTLILSDDTEIPISRKYQNALKEQMDRLDIKGLRV